MKKIATITIIIILLSTTTGCISWRRDDPNTHIRTITFDGIERSYRIHIPLGFEKGYEGSLLFVLHGGGGTAEGMENYLTNKTFNKLSDKHGFIVIYPDGYEKHWNDGRKNVSWQDENITIDDVGFLTRLIDDTVNEFSLDPNRVFFCGISNGGQMSYRMACEKTDRIAGIAAVVSSMSVDLISKCSPKNPIPVFIISGTDDPLVPYDGGEIVLFNKAYGEVISYNETIDYWVSNNNCDAIPNVVYLPDNDPNDQVSIRSEEYLYGDNGSKVLHYIMEGGGHIWPGGPQYFSERIIGKTCRDIDANNEIWAFFSML
jgi:polyhydroxybutyrate depolymerase